MEGFYEQDLAAIHAEGFGALGAAAAEVVADALGEEIAGARVADIGCGAGALAAPLSTAGAEVWGLDISPALLEIARRRAPRARFRQGSLHEVEIPPVEAVCAIGEVVNYMADARAGEAALRRFLEQAAASLRPGGLLLFDAAAPGRGSSRSFTEGPSWAVGSISEETEQRLVRTVTTFRELEGGWRRTQEIHHLALFATDMVLDALESAGFEGEVLPGYGALSPPPGLPVYRAVRNGS